MLGRHADHFMINQMKTRINAVPANGGGQSLSIPDRERAGTPRFTMAATITAGPDSVLNAGDTPGSVPVAAPHTIDLSNGYRPGAEARGMGPADVGAGNATFESFLGADPVSDAAPAVAAPAAPASNKKTLLLIGGALALGYFFLRKKRK